MTDKSANLKYTEYGCLQMQLGNDIMKMCKCLPDYVDVINDMAKQSKKFVPPCNFTQHVKCVAQVIRKFR